MRRKTDVYLLAQNRLLREALLRLLSKKSEIRVIGASGYSEEVREQIVAARPEIVLLDSNGLTFANSTLISTLRAEIRNLGVVMVDMDRDGEIFLKAVRAGVVGYILKDASAFEVTAAIRAVAKGEAVCPAPLSMVLFRSVAEEKRSSIGSRATRYGLSRRESDMVELLRNRLTNKEMAVRLNLSEQTIKNHIHHILRKLGVRNRNNIVEACENGNAGAIPDYSNSTSNPSARHIQDSLTTQRN